MEAAEGWRPGALENLHNRGNNSVRKPCNLGHCKGKESAEVKLCLPLNMSITKDWEQVGHYLGPQEGSLPCEIIADEVGTTQSKHKSSDLLEE